LAVLCVVLPMIFSIQAGVDHSPMRAHWRNALAATVKRFTGRTQIGLSVIAVTGR